MSTWVVSVENLNSDNHCKVEEYTKCDMLLREFATSRCFAKELQVNPKRVSGWLANRDSFEYNGLIYKYKDRATKAQ